MRIEVAVRARRPYRIAEEAVVERLDVAADEADGDARHVRLQPARVQPLRAALEDVVRARQAHAHLHAQATDQTSQQQPHGDYALLWWLDTQVRAHTHSLRRRFAELD